MPRKPNPKSQTPRITICGKPHQEVQIRAAKEIAARNGIDLSDEMFNRGVLSFLRAHNWPPGNSQTVLPVFGVDGKKICGMEGCGKETDVLYHCLFISGLQAWVCKDCKEDAQQRTTLDQVLEVR